MELRKYRSKIKTPKVSKPKIRSGTKRKSPKKLKQSKSKSPDISKTAINKKSTKKEKKVKKKLNKQKGNNLQSKPLSDKTKKKKKDKMSSENIFKALPEMTSALASLLAKNNNLDNTGYVPSISNYQINNYGNNLQQVQSEMNNNNSKEKSKFKKGEVDIITKLLLEISERNRYLVFHVGESNYPNELKKFISDFIYIYDFREIANQSPESYDLIVKTLKRYVKFMKKNNLLVKKEYEEGYLVPNFKKITHFFIKERAALPKFGKQKEIFKRDRKRLLRLMKKFLYPTKKMHRISNVNTYQEKDNIENQVEMKTI
tara:strand:- start:2720 stop:3664 length:945 start_codon:yes stop_codon:yes gene_type:complete